MENKPFTLPSDEVDYLLEQGQWHEAFLLAKKNMIEGLDKMHHHIMDDYEIMEEHKDDDPEINDISSALFQNFINSSTILFLPAINSLLKVFNAVIHEMDDENAVENFDVELESIRDTVCEMLEEEEDL